MNHSRCTICQDAYRPPVRILHCGHSFCEECLDDHFRATSSKKRRCPICRGKVKMKKKDGVERLTRNFAVESMIQANKDVDKANNLRLEKEEGVVTETHTAHLNMLPAARSKSMEILALIRTCMRLCVTNQPDKGKEIVSELKRTIEFMTDSKRVTSMLREDPEGIYICCSELATLTDQFIRLRELDPAVTLNKCRWFLATLLSGEKRLSQFHDIGRSCQPIAEIVVLQRRLNDCSQQQFSFMDKILEAMQNEAGVSTHKKTKAIAGFLKFYGYACNKMGNFAKAIQVNEQAQRLLLKEFGANAANMKIYGYCENNIGSACEQQNNLSKAEHHYKKTLQIYENALDWSSHEEKQESCKLAASNLSRVQANLTRS